MEPDATRNKLTLRDPRADICRGIALWMIVVNHTPGNWLGSITLKNFALSDATEAFVLLAGYAGAFAYAARADRLGWINAATSLTQRVGKLYVAHIFLMVVFTAQVGYSAATLDRGAYLDELALDPFAEQPYRTLLEALLLRFQPAFLDILPLYIVLLALLVPGLALRKWPGLLLGLSAALWLGVRLADFNFPRWHGGGWFFNPLAWQLLFFLGFALGQAARGAPSLPLPRRSPWLTAAAGLVLGAGLLAMIATEWVPSLGERLPEAIPAFLATVDKTAMHPWRLASILALAYLVATYVPRDAAALRGRWARPLLIMGRNSLPVFCVGILLSFMSRLMLEADDGWAMQLASNLLCLGLLVLVGFVSEWQRGDGPAPRTALPDKSALG
ncbi:OpgC family protein [Roseococcus pinisoli]|uniref:OpgC domain-containing protein n=1 Tax=Roseococcus pinisoli TaxID=2835040 RepID=A0ABS5QG27_9PROT|nr:OpgC domain-containing protein [Roseococcus pinisoli]MBS7812529.1 OpgC domain-containing protein [Roseococcus pinisoli]